MRLHRHINRSGSLSDVGIGRVFSQRDEAPDTSCATPDWIFKGACSDTDVDMTADASTEKQLLAQRAVCMRCPVSFECLKELIEINPPRSGTSGIRAGLTSTDWNNYKRYSVLEVGMQFGKKKLKGS